MTNNLYDMCFTNETTLNPPTNVNLRIPTDKKKFIQGVPIQLQLNKGQCYASSPTWIGTLCISSSSSLLVTPIIKQKGETQTWWNVLGVHVYNKRDTEVYFLSPQNKMQKKFYIYGNIWKKHFEGEEQYQSFTKARGCPL